jgi:Na+-driven multidrug efflux pump
MNNRKKLLSTIWIFLTVNFIFCDVFTLMYSEDLKQLLSGKVGEIELTQEFLLIFAIIMEIPMLMIVLSRVLNYKLNRLYVCKCKSISNFGFLCCDNKQIKQQNLIAYATDNKQN